MPEAKKMKVLVVDDQPSLRALVMTSLRQIGISQVTQCNNGEEAFSELMYRPVNLVISDLNMPKLDGIGLLRKVRSEPSIAKTAFIMLTSRAEIDLVHEAVQLGVNNYIIKPFNFGALQSKIEAVFGKLT